MDKIIAANWKMNKTSLEAENTVLAMSRLLGGTVPAGKKVIVFAPFTALENTACAIRSIEGAYAGAQNLYPAESGAFTGEISPAMIQACGARAVLTGHSERRHILGESDQVVALKTAFALEHGLDTMLCIGETLEEREAGLLHNVLERQLRIALSFDRGLLEKISFYVAYEPVWAIGTGKTATPGDITEAHSICRSIMRAVMGTMADSVPLLYGGSVKPSNAGQILLLDNVDGVLVGGASLEAEQFCKIINA